MKVRAHHEREPELRIDLNAIATNFRYLKTLVGSGTDVAAVVKSDAYGLGANLVVPALLDAGCHTFFVADLREAIQIRARFPKLVQLNILAGAEECDIEIYQSYRLTPVCGRLREALAARRLPMLMVSIDTGFSRFGLTFAEVRAFAHMARRRPDLVISHLACADEILNTTNRLQRDRFVGMCQMLQPDKKSLAASAAVWLGPRYHFDLVRAGSALFGLNNAGIKPNLLRPVVQLFARLAEVRTVHYGEIVGYAASFRATRSMRIGIVALGYAHGLPWSAGNAVSAMIGSHRAPVVGRVAMEYVALDLSDVPSRLCTEGQAVEFVGPSLPVETMAKAVHTVPQELLVRLGTNCPHHYADLVDTLAGGQANPEDP